MNHTDLAKKQTSFGSKPARPVIASSSSLTLSYHISVLITSALIVTKLFQGLQHVHVARRVSFFHKECFFLVVIVTCPMLII